ncbi:MAG: hypothetical protein ACO1QB_10615 [Verrucomicrobiales bacterium]
MNLKLLLILPIFFIGVGCNSQNSSNKANRLHPLVFLEYKIQGGFRGGTSYMLVISTTNTELGTITTALKKEAYLVSPEVAQEINALLHDRNFFTWESQEETDYADLNRLTLSVFTAISKKEVTVYQTPGNQSRMLREMTNLIQTLQIIAMNQGSLLNEIEDPK